MLNALKKAVGITADSKLEQGALDAPMLATQLAEAVEMLTANEGIIAELNSNIGNMAKEIEGYKQQLEALKVYADEAEAKAVAAAEEMKAKEIADKKQQLADVIGADNKGFDATWNAVAGLDAEAFTVVINGFKASFAAEANSEMFVEKGVSGDAEPVEDKESATMKIIKKTYKNK